MTDGAAPADSRTPDDELSRAMYLWRELLTDRVVAIDRWIADRQSEEQWLDFKSVSAPAGTYTDNKQKRENEKNFAKAASAFANSGGGVIVWGVYAHASHEDPNADFARGKSPIPDAAKFKSMLERMTSRVTEPPVRGVRHEVISISDASIDGYVVSLIPSSPNAPHRATADGDFYIRAGSDCVRAPYVVLASLFGRRPQPSVDALVSVTRATVSPINLNLEFVIEAHNTSAVMGRRPYVWLQLLEYPKGRDVRGWGVSKPKFAPCGEKTHFKRMPDSAVGMSDVSAVEGHDSLLLPRDSCSLVSVVVEIHVDDANPVKDGLNIKGTVGCEGAAPREFSLTIEELDLQGEIDLQRTLGYSEDVTTRTREAEKRLFRPETLRGGFYRHEIRTIL